MSKELTQDVLDFLESIENDTETIPPFMIEWRDRLVKELTAELAKTAKINRRWYVTTYRYLQLGGIVKPWCHPDAVLSFADNVGF